jgi:thioredoxin reductase (NADPH)
MEPRTPTETDALIIGAGPAGLFQVFQLGLLEINCHVIDALPHAGGQCVELYGDKPIYDIPSVPLCTGRELVSNLLTQIAPFKAQFHFGQTVTQIDKQADGRFAVVTSQGTTLIARTVFIAAGVGAFAPKKLSLPGLDAFDNRQVFHHVTATTTPRWTGRSSSVRATWTDLPTKPPASRWCTAATC